MIRISYFFNVTAVKTRWVREEENIHSLLGHVELSFQEWHDFLESIKHSNTFYVEEAGTGVKTNG